MTLASFFEQLISSLHQTAINMLGGKPLEYYLEGFTASGLAIVLSLLLHSTTRNPKSVSTPEKFKWWYPFTDNLRRLVAGIILAFIFYRIFDFTSFTMKIGFGFFISFGMDKAMQYLMEYTNIANFLKSARKQRSDKEKKRNNFTNDPNDWD